MFTPVLLKTNLEGQRQFFTNLAMAAAELLVKFSFRIRDKDYTQIFFMSVDAEERLELGQMKTKR